MRKTTPGKTGGLRREPPVVVRYLCVLLVGLGSSVEDRVQSIYFPDSSVWLGHVVDRARAVRPEEAGRPRRYGVYRPCGAWSERGEAMGRAWKSTPNTFAEEQPFDRSVDLIEGGCFEIHGINAMLPMEEEQMSGLGIGDEEPSEPPKASTPRGPLVVLAVALLGGGLWFVSLWPQSYSRATEMGV